MSNTREAAAFFDAQVNGFGGTDFNNPRVTTGDYQRAIESMWKTGVTRFFPTIITASHADMCECLRSAARVAEMSQKETRAIGSSIAGIHVEGPSISPEDGPRGAHPRQHVRAPDRDEFLRLQEAARGLIRLVTLAPEWPEAAKFVAWLRERGIAVAIGHTAATSAQIAEAVRAGARISTHLGNGCAPMVDRLRNPIWEQLACDDLCVSLIVDGHHLPPGVVQSMIRAKCPERVILVTDASSPAGCEPGAYRLGEQQVDLSEPSGPGGVGRVEMHGVKPKRLAGSALSMHQAVANTVRFAGVSLDDALAMAGSRASALFGLSFPNDRVILEDVSSRPTNQTHSSARCGVVIHKVFRDGELLWPTTS